MGHAVGPLLVGLVGLLGAADDGDAPKLAMAKPVVCRKVHGYASFEPLPGATLTVDDKLTVYSEPSSYTIEKTDEGFRALLTVDGRLRKKGTKEVVYKKDRMIEYEAKRPHPPYQIFIRAEMSLKGFPPGEYELDLTLRDGLAKDSSAMRTVAFKIARSAEVPEPDPKEEPAGKAPETKKPPRPGPRRPPTKGT